MTGESQNLHFGAQIDWANHSPPPMSHHQSHHYVGSLSYWNSHSAYRTYFQSLSQTHPASTPGNTITRRYRLPFIVPRATGTSKLDFHTNLSLLYCILARCMKCYCYLQLLVTVYWAPWNEMTQDLALPRTGLRSAKRKVETMDPQANIILAHKINPNYYVNGEFLWTFWWLWALC